ncbi:hypothetical protein PENSTE_c003G02536 [Penicillium steckii]|uniref:Uncharacterized protein n=1 Tax=Penicillium steckii TaxID=303698 RepID=A0A1V6TQT1_9EURO|nr:hypothetical protein PENSTE_c003G02536 [Penicillium steckii]
MSEVFHLDEPSEGHHHPDQGGSIKQRQNSEKSRQEGTHPDEKKKAKDTSNKLPTGRKPTDTVHEEGEN